MALIANPYEAKRDLALALANALTGEASNRGDQLADAIERLIDEKLLDLENKINQTGDYSRDY